MNFIYGIVNSIRFFVGGTSLLIILFFTYAFIKEPCFEKHCTSCQSSFGEVGKVIARILPIILFIAVLSHPVTMQLFGYKNLQLLDDGEYTFYIERDGKTYPALIEINEMSDDDSSKRWKEYYVIAIDYGVNISQIEETDESIVIGKKCRVYPEGKDYEEGYDIILLNKPAYSTNLQETNKFNLFQYISLIVEITGLVLLYILLTRDYDKRYIKNEISSYANEIKSKCYEPTDFWNEFADRLHYTYEKSIIKRMKTENCELQEVAFKMIMESSEEYIAHRHLYVYHGEVDGYGKEAIDIYTYAIDSMVKLGYMTVEEKEESIKRVYDTYLS